MEFSVDTKDKCDHNCSIHGRGNCTPLKITGVGGRSEPDKREVMPDGRIKLTWIDISGGFTQTVTTYE